MSDIAKTLQSIDAEAAGMPIPGVGCACPKCEATTARNTGKTHEGNSEAVLALECAKCGAVFPSIGWTVYSTGINDAGEYAKTPDDIATSADAKVAAQVVAACDAAGVAVSKATRDKAATAKDSAVEGIEK